MEHFGQINLIILQIDKHIFIQQAQKYGRKQMEKLMLLFVLLEQVGHYLELDPS